MTDAGSAVIVDAVRTPIGRGSATKGCYRDTHPAALLAASYLALLERTGVDPKLVDDVLSGCVMQYGEQTYNIARNAWLQAGLPYQVPATTLDRQCGSGQQAVNFAAGMIAAGLQSVVIGAGVEHMGHNPLVDPFSGPHGVAWTPELRANYDVDLQSVGAELIADDWNVSRADMDEFSLLSQQRAAAAASAGRFSNEIIPVAVNGETVLADQGIRPGTTLEGLAALRPAFNEGGRLTAGNSSQISDGAAAIMLMSSAKAAELGMRPRAEIVDQVVVGVDPRTMLTGPIPATEQILARNSMSIGDIDLFEVNEAFATIVIAWERAVGADRDRVNVNGGAIALGHPVGATGARLFATLLNELERSDSELGLVTMCCGGGLGTATLVRRV